MARNKEKYPHIVLLNSSGHYPERYVQVTTEELNDLNKNRDKYEGQFGIYNNLDYLQRGESAIEREISIKEVDALPKDITRFCEYC